MKMIIVLDKICLMGVIAVSLYIGYKAGEVSNDIRLAKEIFKENKSELHEVSKED